MLFIVIPGIMLISTIITRIGFYHQKVSEKCNIPKWFYDLLLYENSLKPFQINFPEMFLNYIILSIPLYFTFVYLLNPSNFLENSCEISCSTTNINNAFIASLSTIPVYLLSIRLLTNPLKKDFYYLKWINKFYQKETSKSLLKERIISFYFALTATTFFIMVMAIIYKFLGFSKDWITFYTTLIDLFRKSFIPQFNNLQIFLFICAYFVTLLILTATIEYLFEKGEPIKDI